MEFFIVISGIAASVLTIITFVKILSISNNVNRIVSYNKFNVDRQYLHNVIAAKTKEEQGEAILQLLIHKILKAIYLYECPIEEKTYNNYIDQIKRLGITVPEHFETLASFKSHYGIILNKDIRIRLIRK